MRSAIGDQAQREKVAQPVHQSRRSRRRRPKRLTGVNVWKTFSVNRLRRDSGELFGRDCVIPRGRGQEDWMGQFNSFIQVIQIIDPTRDDLLGSLKVDE